MTDPSGEMEAEEETEEMAALEQVEEPVAALAPMPGTIVIGETRFFCSENGMNAAPTGAQRTNRGKMVAAANGLLLRQVRAIQIEEILALQGEEVMEPL